MEVRDIKYYCIIQDTPSSGGQGQNNRSWFQETANRGGLKWGSRKRKKKWEMIFYAKKNFSKICKDFSFSLEQNNYKKYYSYPISLKLIEYKNDNITETVDEFVLRRCSAVG